jgi:hypothetical protein
MYRRVMPPGEGHGLVIPLLAVVIFWRQPQTVRSGDFCLFYQLNIDLCGSWVFNRPTPFSVPSPSALSLAAGQC